VPFVENQCALKLGRHYPPVSPECPGLGDVCSAPRKRTTGPALQHGRFVPIVLQKSQNAVRLNFRQRTKQAVIVDRCRFNRATEVISEFVTE
jgi:hypothetical protein